MQEDQYDYKLADKDLGFKATCDFTFSIGAGDNLRLGIWDYNGSGYGYSYVWNGPAYLDWTSFEIPISDWIKNIATYATPTSAICSLRLPYKESATSP